jgi:FkbH-like protein
LRLDSIRQGAAFQRALGSAVPEDFLRQLDAIIGLDFQPNPESERVLELVNKTNQFNLNGVRYTQADWRDASARAGAITVALSYEDRYGPLGTIGVIQGRLKDRVLYVDVWVMSCRAFARRIEHQCLRTLFEKTGAEELILDFRPTAKNAPLRAWLREMLSVEPSSACTLSRTDFERNCPTLYHRVVEVNQP